MINKFSVSLCTTGYNWSAFSINVELVSLCPICSTGKTFPIYSIGQTFLLTFSWSAYCYIFNWSDSSYRFNGSANSQGTKEGQYICQQVISSPCIPDYPFTPTGNFTMCSIGQLLPYMFNWSAVSKMLNWSVFSLYIKLVSKFW